MPRGMVNNGPNPQSAITCNSAGVSSPIRSQHSGNRSLIWRLLKASYFVRPSQQIHHIRPISHDLSTQHNISMTHIRSYINLLAGPINLLYHHLLLVFLFRKANLSTHISFSILYFNHECKFLSPFLLFVFYRRMQIYHTSTLCFSIARSKVIKLTSLNHSVYSLSFFTKLSAIYSLFSILKATLSLLYQIFYPISMMIL